MIAPQDNYRAPGDDPGEAGVPGQQLQHGLARRDDRRQGAGRATNIWTFI